MAVNPIRWYLFQLARRHGLNGLAFRLMFSKKLTPAQIEYGQQLWRERMGVNKSEFGRGS